MKCLLIPFNRLYWLPACLLFICFSNELLAAIAPPGVVVNNNGLFSSASSYCTTAATNLGRTYKEVTVVPVTTNPGSSVGGTYTGLASASNGGSTFTCKDVNNLSYGQIGTIGQYCLSADGFTNSNGILSCTVCPAGTQDINGTCTVPPECPTAGTTKNAAVAISGISGQQGIGASMCADSGNSTCGIKCNSGIASYNDVSGQSSVYCDSYEFTGSACASAPVAVPVSGVPAQNQATPVNSPPKSAADCPGGSGFAQVNNTSMCLPSGTQYSSGSNTTTSSTGSVTTSSITTINNNGTSTTTTINTYKDAAGNVTYSGTGTTTGSINQAQGGGTGQGDKPSLGDAPTFDTTLPQESTFNIKAQGNPVLTNQIFQASASCPPPIPFTAMGREFEISFDAICSFADVIRGIILVISAISAMRIVTTN